MNKFLKTLFLVSMLIVMALAITMQRTTAENSERGTTRSRFLWQRSSRSKGSVTCDKNPKVCHTMMMTRRGGGPYCCKNKCVDLSTDELNCGRCGKKCGHNKICCVGKCVNPMTNEKHCGKCGHKCNSKQSCVYGMCSYG